MRAVRSFLCWMFALGAVIFLKLSVSALVDIARRPAAHFPFTPLSAFAIAALPALAALYSMGCWTFWRGKASMRIWGMAASAASGLLGCLFFYLDWRYLWESGGTLFDADAFILAVGVVGLIAFRRADPAGDDEAMQPIAGDGTSAIVNRMIWVLGTGGFLAVMSGWSQWSQRQGLPSISTSIMNELALIMLAELTMAALHEMGHAAAGKALGMKLCAFIVGPFQWRVNEDKWEFHFTLFGFFGIGGATAVVPTTPRQAAWREICMVAAGPIVSFVTGCLALWAALHVAGTRWEPMWWLLAIFSTLSLITALLNCIPFRTQGFYSDGARIYQLVSDGPLADLHRAFSAAAATTVTPLRPRDYDISAIRRAGTFIAVGQQALLLRLLASSYYLDSGQIVEAGDALSEAEEVYQISAPEIPASLHATFVFGKAYMQHDGAGTRRWWEMMQAKHPTCLDADYWLARSAYYWTEHRLDEAWESWEKGNALAQQLPQTGASDTDRDHFALLRRELEASRAMAAAQELPEACVQTIHCMQPELVVG